MSKVSWWKIKNQSLANAVRNVGFDLAVYDEYTPQTQKEIRKQAITEALRLLRDEFSATAKKDIKQITCGVYVICLSDPFTIKYGKKNSKIIYIGRGNVFARLKSHYETSLFNFMQSLSGTNFDFYISEPKKRGGGKANDYYKHIEHRLLEKFSENIGGGEKEFPLFNINAGANKNLDEGKGWDKPLSSAGEKPQWILEKTRFWNFEKLG